MNPVTNPGSERAAAFNGIRQSQQQINSLFQILFSVEQAGNNLTAEQTDALIERPLAALKTATDELKAKVTAMTPAASSSTTK